MGRTRGGVEAVCETGDHDSPQGERGRPEAVIGEDKVDWKAVFDICEAQGVTEWYIVEHESSKDPLDAVKRSF